MILLRDCRSRACDTGPPISSGPLSTEARARGRPEIADVRLQDAITYTYLRDCITSAVSYCHNYLSRRVTTAGRGVRRKVAQRIAPVAGLQQRPPQNDI